MELQKRLWTTNELTAGPYWDQPKIDLISEETFYTWASLYRWKAGIRLAWALLWLALRRWRRRRSLTLPESSVNVDICHPLLRHINFLARAHRFIMRLWGDQGVVFMAKIIWWGKYSTHRWCEWERYRQCRRAAGTKTLSRQPTPTRGRAEVKQSDCEYIMSRPWHFGYMSGKFCVHKLIAPTWTGDREIVAI